jgi:hypothetical protein
MAYKQNMTTRLFKSIDCDTIYIQHNNSPTLLTTFLSSITFDSILSQHHNSILCSVQAPAAIVYFTNYQDSIYSLSFASSPSVTIKHLSFSTAPDADKIPYINYLINDTARKWVTVATLTSQEKDTASSSSQLSNQVLTLLRICHIDKDDYIKNPSLLSQKFAKQ